MQNQNIEFFKIYNECQKHSRKFFDMTLSIVQERITRPTPTLQDTCLNLLASFKELETNLTSYNEHFDTTHAESKRIIIDTIKLTVQCVDKIYSIIPILKKHGRGNVKKQYIKSFNAIPKKSITSLSETGNAFKVEGKYDLAIECFEAAIDIAKLCNEKNAEVRLYSELEKCKIKQEEAVKQEETKNTVKTEEEKCNWTDFIKKEEDCGQNIGR